MDTNLYCICPNAQGDTSSISTAEDGPLAGMNMGVSVAPQQILFETGSTDFRMRLFLYADIESELNAVIINKKSMTPSDTSSLSSPSSIASSGRFAFQANKKQSLTASKINDHFALLDNAVSVKSNSSKTNSDFYTG